MFVLLEQGGPWKCGCGRPERVLLQGGAFNTKVVIVGGTGSVGHHHIVVEPGGAPSTCS